MTDVNKELMSKTSILYFYLNDLYLSHSTQRYKRINLNLNYIHVCSTRVYLKEMNFCIYRIK